MNWVRQRALCSLYFFVAECWVERQRLGPGLAAWRSIRSRGLGPAGLHLVGVLLLVLARTGVPTGRVIRKWKGWARLRTNPELV